MSKRTLIWNRLWWEVDSLIIFKRFCTQQSGDRISCSVIRCLWREEFRIFLIKDNLSKIRKNLTESVLYIRYIGIRSRRFYLKTPPSCTQEFMKKKYLCPDEYVLADIFWCKMSPVSLIRLNKLALTSL